MVAGSGFKPFEGVDLFFDTTDLALAIADGSGKVSQTLQVPTWAQPGTNWFTGLGRTSGIGAQKSFLVRTNWAQFRNGPLHKGYNPFENTLNPANVSGLAEAWAAPTAFAIGSSPAVVNGVVYIDSFGKLYAFNASTGAPLPAPWPVNTGGCISQPPPMPPVCSPSSPAVANGVVYVGSLDGKLYAFNASTGAPLPAPWPVSTGGEIFSAPAVVNGVVYVGSNDHKLYAFHAVSGASLPAPWPVSTGGFVESSPAVANGVVYVGSFDGKLYAFNATTGAPLPAPWPLSTGGSIGSSPAVANGVVYVGSTDGKLYAFDSISGVSLPAPWPVSTGTGSYIVTSPAVANGVVYIGSFNIAFNSKLYAFNAITGASLPAPWPVSAGPLIQSSPAVANGVVYVGSYDNNLYAFDATGGALLWAGATSGHIESSSPAVANGVVYVGSDDSSLHTYNLNAAFTSLATRMGVETGSPTGPPDLAHLVPNHSLQPQS